MREPTLRLELEIDPAAQPLTGTVRRSGMPAQTFTGWTQFGHAVDTAIADARARIDANGHDGEPAGSTPRSKLAPSCSRDRH